MHIVIAGAGSVGFQIARQLIEEGNDVVLVEKDEDTARQVDNQLDCIVLHGEGTSLEVLRRAQIQKADIFISVTDSDEVNMIACGLVSSEFEVPLKIARIRNIDYSNARLLEKPMLGIDYIANPEFEAARVIIRTVEGGAVSDIMLFEQGSFQMRSFVVGEDSVFRDRTLEQIRADLQIPFLVALIDRDNASLIPTGNTVIRENDHLYLVASEENLEKVFARTGRPPLRANRILIVGGGRIGRYVGRSLLRETGRTSLFARFTRSLAPAGTRSVTFVERSYEQCQRLSEEFPEALVIHGDVSDEGVLEETQPADYDLIITATGHQELNLITGAYAKTLGIKRAVALVSKDSYARIASHLGIDVPVSMKNSLANTILRVIRRGNVRSVHSLSGGKVELIELSVEETSPVVGQRIRDIRMPAHSLVVFVTRGGESIIPGGDLEIHSGDHVILVAQRESVKKAEDLFTPGP
jgi:trk system potassium uptake protein TrkA